MTKEDKFKNLIVEKYRSPNNFASVLGIPVSTVYSILKNGLGSASTATMFEMCEALGITLDDLYKTENAPVDITEAFDTKQYNPGTPVPIIGTIRAGYNGLAYEELDGYRSADVANAKEFIYLKVKGDSMEPQIQDGCLALIHLTDKDIVNGKVYACIINGNEGTLKRVFEQGDNSFMLAPFNSTYQPEIVTADNLIIVGRLKETLCLNF